MSYYENIDKYSSFNPSIKISWYRKFCVEIGLTIILISVFLLIFALLKQAEKNRAINCPTCNSCSLYSDLLAAYKAGNRHLDGSRGIKGVPCEAVLKRQS